jgi:hypothetical protein
MSLELKEVASNDFLDMGKDLMNPNWGRRYFKYSDKKQEHGFKLGDLYIGEWSTTTNKPHGRGIHIDSYGLSIGYFNNGDYTGKYTTIYKNGGFDVGEITRDSDGNEHNKGMLYNADGTIKPYDY